MPPMAWQTSKRRPPETYSRRIYTRFGISLPDGFFTIPSDP